MSLRLCVARNEKNSWQFVNYSSNLLGTLTMKMNAICCYNNNVLYYACRQRSSSCFYLTIAFVFTIFMKNLRFCLPNWIPKNTQQRKGFVVAYSFSFSLSQNVCWVLSVFVCVCESNRTLWCSPIASSNRKKMEKPTFFIYVLRVRGNFFILFMLLYLVISAIYLPAKNVFKYCLWRKQKEAHTEVRLIFSD